MALLLMPRTAQAGITALTRAMSRAVPRALALAALLGATPGAQAAPAGSQLTCHAASDGSAAASGLDWSSATTLQAALGSGACSSIRLKQGIYRPTAGTDRSASFAINAPVHLLGGYTGNSTAPEERATDPRLTVLSGDIDGNDNNRTGGITPAATDIQGGNSFNVVESPRARHSLMVAQDQHRQVLDAIAAREGARAEALMKEHSRIARRNLREAVSEPGSHAVPGVQLIDPGRQPQGTPDRQPVAHCASRTR